MTTTQAELDLSPLVHVEHDHEATIGERFTAFHEANLHVADALESLAATWLAHHSRVGVKALFERLRWEAGIQTNATDYRLNNNFTSHYARLLIDRNPTWADAINVRELRAA